MHISYEAGILEDPAFTPAEDMFKKTQSPKKAPDEETELEIEFEKGNPVKVKNLKDNTVKRWQKNAQKMPSLKPKKRNPEKGTRVSIIRGSEDATVAVPEIGFCSTQYTRN